MNIQHVYRVGFQHNRWVVIVPRSRGATDDVIKSYDAIQEEIERMFSEPVTCFDYMEHLGTWQPPNPSTGESDDH